MVATFRSRLAHIAGAKRSLLTLYVVNDKMTALFMGRFYEHLAKDHQPIAEAFSQTKRDVWLGKLTGIDDPTFTPAFVLFEN